MNIKEKLEKYFAKNKDAYDGIDEESFPEPDWLGEQDQQEMKKLSLPHGVVLGKSTSANRFTLPFLRHPLKMDTSPETVLLLGPTRSGKSASTVIPTAFSWQGNLFVLDGKGEAAYLTSKYRENVLGQKIIRFNPSDRSDRAIKWNPLAEIRLGTVDELPDVMTIVDCLLPVSTDAFYVDHARLLLQSVILHLLYKHRKENLPTATLADVQIFLSRMDAEDMLREMRDYAHITPAEFLERAYRHNHRLTARDKTGRLVTLKNPLKEVFGEYIQDYAPFQEELGDVHSLESIRLRLHAMEMQGERICWDAETDGLPSEYPFHLLLTHPLVAACAGNILNLREERQQTIIQTALGALDAFAVPLVRRNTSASDFRIADLADTKGEKKTTCYFILTADCFLHFPVVARLFVATLLNATMQKTEYQPSRLLQPAEAKPLLLMLDNFTDIGKIPHLAEAMASLPGDGTKLLLTALDAAYISRLYGDFDVFASRCGIRAYYKPNATGSPSMQEIIIRDLQGTGQFCSDLSVKDICNMPSDRVIVIRHGNRVDTYKKVRYFGAEKAFFPLP